jgi:uncharacterized membrane protein YgcG
MSTTGRARHRTPHAVALAAMLALLAFLALPAPGGAAGVIQDDAKFFSPAAVASAAQRSQQVQQATGKTIALRTIATIGSKDDAAASAAADKVFQELQLNGVLIFVVKDAGKLVLKVGQDTRQLVSVAEETTIRNAMLARFNAKDFDGGLQAGLDALDRDLRAGAAPANGGQQGAAAPARTAPAPARDRGFGLFPLALLCLLPLALIGLAVFFVARRRGGGSGGFTGGAGGGAYPAGGPGYGGPGYGGGGGYGGNYGGGYGPTTGGGPGFGAGAAVGGLGGLVAGGLIAHELDQRNDGGQQGHLGGDYAGGTGGNFGSPGQGQAGGYGNDAGVPSDSGQDVGDFGGGGDVGTFGGDSGGGDSGAGGGGDVGSFGGDSGGD